jgi:hypothetical protein
MQDAFTMCMTEHAQQHALQRVMRADDPDLGRKRLDVGSVSCVPSTRWITLIFGNFSGIECVTACCCV